MTPLQHILMKARRQLFLLGAAVIIGGFLFTAGLYLDSRLKESQFSNNIQLGAMQSELEQKKQDLQNIQVHIEQFRMLKNKGLVGTTDREGWVEQFIASKEALGALSGTFLYALEPPLPASDGSPDPAAVIEPGAPLRHDFSFELNGIHEADLLHLLNDYKSRVNGQFRVDSCQLGSPTPSGLTAKCTLRFFSLPETDNPS
jgi:hypothetical protein